VPFEAAGQGLNPNAPVVSPARQVVVEVVDAATSQRIGVTTTTDGTGAYSLPVPQNRSVVIRARAEMVKSDAAPTWNFRVLNNTNADALYVIQGAAFNSGTADSTRNLRALTGWNGTTYVDADRAAAAFAILDTVYQAKQLVLSAAPATTFAPLDLFWSPNNRTLANPFCPDIGNIGTSFYTPSGSTDECTGPGPNALPGGIYILGAYANGAGDTDEFDQHVIAHEFGHYFEDRFSRSDSVGGPHGAGDRLDPRVAFGEGWGNAYSAMTLNDPNYRDSQQGVTSDFGFSLETDSTNAEGWFSEASVGEIIWDIFDAAADPGDAVSLGFTPIFAVMNGSQRTTDALTSIFTFATAIRAANATASAAIGNLLSGEVISGTDDFGTGETNNGGITNVSILPIYPSITTAAPQVACLRKTGNDDNKLGYARFFQFNHTGTSFAISATGTAVSGTGNAASDPDIFVYRRGVTVATAENTGPSDSVPAGLRPAGLYIIEVIDFDHAGGAAVLPTCMSVAVTAN